MTELRTCHTAELRSAELAAVRRLLNKAYGARCTDEDWDHTLGGLHTLARARSWTSARRSGVTGAPATCGDGVPREKGLRRGFTRLSPPSWLVRFVPSDDARAPRVNRRAFLRGAVVGGVSLATAGAAFGVDRRSDFRSRELDGAAAPAGWRRPLGERRLVWSVPTTLPLAALTFDDGPDPELTPRVLEVLADHHATATFNMMGWNASRHPELVRAVVAAGHELGNHTWTHLDLTELPARRTRNEVDLGRQAIEAAGAVRLRWFRPPRGELTGAATCAAAELGQDLLLWSVDRGPGGVGTPEAVADHLDRAVGPGDVVGLHDGIGRGTFDPDGALAKGLRARRLVELAALPLALERLQARGIRLVTASELVEAASPAAATA
jgi:peptidoglycan/xylan/chitin deacetylase (PgdA/CDA1 family)